MEKEKLAPWIERLNKAEKKDRETIAAEFAKENNLKIPDAWKLLKNAGFDPNAEPPREPLRGAPPAPDNGGAPPANETQAGEKKQSVVLRHKTEYPKYRRAGLALTQKAETYEVTAEQLAALKKDSWVVIGEGKKDGK